jgi:hypothetical protein
MLFNYLAFATGLLPVIAAIINYRNLTRILKLAAILFTIAFLVDFLSYLYYLGFIKLSNNNNQPFFHLSIIINLVFYSIIYYRSFFKYQLKKFTLILGVLALTLVLFFTIKDSIWKYPSWGNTVLCLYMIIVSLLYFYQILEQQEFIHIEEQPLFWISSFNIFLYMLYDKLKDPMGSYTIHRVTDIITNLLFVTGLLCKTRKTT